MPEEWNYSANNRGTLSISHIFVFTALHFQVWLTCQPTENSTKSLYLASYVSTKKQRVSARHNSSGDFQQQERFQRNPWTLILLRELLWAAHSPPESKSCARDERLTVYITETTCTGKGSMASLAQLENNGTIVLVHWTGTWEQPVFSYWKPWIFLRIQNLQSTRKGFVWEVYLWPSGASPFCWCSFTFSDHICASVLGRQHVWLPPTSRSMWLVPPHSALDAKWFCLPNNTYLEIYIPPSYFCINRT